MEVSIKIIPLKLIYLEKEKTKLQLSHLNHIFVSGGSRFGLKKTWIAIILRRSIIFTLHTHYTKYKQETKLYRYRNFLHRKLYIRLYNYTLEVFELIKFRYFVFRGPPAI